MVSLTGYKNTLYLRDKYQKLLESDYHDVQKMINFLISKTKALRTAYNEALKYKKNIEDDEAEREKQYKLLGSLLKKETDFERMSIKETSAMHKKVSKHISKTGARVKQKNKFGDQEANFSMMMKYLEKHPEYQTKSTFKRILEKIDQLEAHIDKYVKKKKTSKISEYNILLEGFKLRIDKAEDKMEKYKEDLKEGKERIGNSRFRKGMIYNMLSEESKDKLELDLSKHRMKQYENSLKNIKSEVSKFAGKEFVEMEF